MKLKTVNIDQEEEEAIQAYDEAKTSNDEAILFAQAVQEIEGEARDENERPGHSVPHAESVKTK